MCIRDRFLISLPFSISQRVLLAFQEGKIAAYAQVFSNGFGLFGLFAATQLKGGLLALVACYIGAQAVSQIAVAAWLFAYHKPELSPIKLPSYRVARSFFKVSALLFLCEIATLVFFQKDNLLLSY